MQTICQGGEVHRVVLVCTGFGPRASRERNRPLDIDPIEARLLLGVEPDATVGSLIQSCPRSVIPAARRRNTEAAQWWILTIAWNGVFGERRSVSVSVSGGTAIAIRSSLSLGCICSMISRQASSLHESRPRRVGLRGVRQHLEVHAEPVHRMAQARRPLRRWRRIRAHLRGYPRNR
jgi:hypothetical protein